MYRKCHCGNKVSLTNISRLQLKTKSGCTVENCHFVIFTCSSFRRHLCVHSNWTVLACPEISKFTYLERVAIQCNKLVNVWIFAFND